ncbi:MAG: tetratricopeptide repeat protein [bacterium]|nr:tetratricopeptide repeat protein [bacterium]
MAILVGALLLTVLATPVFCENAEPQAAEVNPLELTAEMRAFVDRLVQRDQPRHLRLFGLQDAIFDPDEGLGVAYSDSTTHTAAGTFETRSGNCLSFTLLFVAMARYVGLQAHFIEVDEVTGWSQRGDVGVSHWHMYAEVELPTGAVRVDFLPWLERRYRSSRQISEARVRAHYHNNVRADVLTQGFPGKSLVHFQKALQLDRTFNPARINMAVAHRRTGDPAKAEAGLLQVLRDEPTNAVAATNLAGLYLASGRQEDAKKWLRRRERFLNRNPFHHFRLGLSALHAGGFARARTHFKRAIARQPDEPAFFEQLAECHFRLGETRKAQKSLRRALRLTRDPQRRRSLEERLDEERRQADGSS